ncbi:MAG: dTMP kinase [Citromicrobium sp.]|uniref:dTMP kinase n=1 Tax=unclassified Citromicrobium TaxID=2630544 RepID=UPI0009E73702|nr:MULTISPECIES: dTMP kinase [unclassified Citromicrobium]MAO95712.1 dTMP kinase [Citromicrobium sp.]MAY77626.1 dTMP kinase [Citromicrobium sp.]
MTHHDIKARFIAFEGGEGVGKSTQAKRLVEALANRGIDALLTREPGGTTGAEMIRKLLLEPPGTGWRVQAEALLFAAARSDHVAKAIKPALMAGRWVVCDRFVLSSRAYQGLAGGLGDEEVRTLHQIGSGGLLPCRTILLEAPGDDVAERLRKRDGDEVDAIGGRDARYHADVARGFAGLAQDDDTIIQIDASGSADAVHEAVMRELAPLLVGEA